MRWPRGAEPLLLTCFTLSKWKALDEALSMICIILQIIGKPNVVIVLLFIQNNWYYKSCLPRSMSSSRLYLYVPQQFQEYKELFNVGYSTNSSSHPLSNIFNVFPMFWGRIRLCPLRKASENFSPIYTETTELTQPLYPRASRFPHLLPDFSGDSLYYWRDFTG